MLTVSVHDRKEIKWQMQTHTDTQTHTRLHVHTHLYSHTQTYTHAKLGKEDARIFKVRDALWQ